MKIIDFKKQVEKDLSQKNFFERMPGVLHTLFVPGEVAVRKMGALGWIYFYALYKNDNMTLIYPEDRQIELGEIIFKRELKKKGYYKGMIDRWKKKYTKFRNICSDIDRLNIDDLKLIEQKKYYIRFMSSLQDVWAEPLTSNNISFYAESVWMPKITKKYRKVGLEEFTVLSTPKEPSFLKQEEHELLRIAAGKGEKQNKNLKEHIKKYFWIQTTYRSTRILDEKYFMEQVNDLRKMGAKSLLKSFEDKQKYFQKKRKLIEKNNRFTDEEKTIANLVSHATTFQDLRKKNNLVGNCYIFKFLKSASKKTGYSYRQLCYTDKYEFIDILDGKGLKKDELDRRNDLCIHYIGEKNSVIYGGKEKQGLFDYIEGFDKVKGDILEISGMAASLGKAEGIVRVVPDASKVKRFDKGDILVASMTRPEYTQLMKKAGAIVTDEGGITSHAAIVAREIGIPCIIGTRIASKTLKDGDFVEVDADKGVVKILKAWQTAT